MVFGDIKKLLLYGGFNKVYDQKNNKIVIKAW